MVTVAVEPQEVYNAGCDWLTMTYKPQEYEAFQQALKGANIIMGMEVQGGATEKQCRLRDYEGVRAGAVFAGGREDGYIIEASSDKADYLAQFVIQNGCEGRASRLDLQATIRLDRDRRGIARDTLARIFKQEQEGAWPSQMGFSFFAGGDRGDSLYVGSRSSEVYRRLYDKSRESGLEAGLWLWRWEVEFKGKRARQAMVTLYTYHNNAACAQNLVGTDWRKLGLPESWMFHVKHDELAPLPQKTDDEKRLKWLEKLVRPSVNRLRRNGRGDDALDALGYGES